MEDTIYDFVADAVLPLSQASTESLRDYVRNTPDDGYIEHNLILGCIIELEKRGVPVEFILQDDKALDTIQNLINSVILLSEKENKSLEEILNSNIVIVSSDYHLSRSLWIAKRLGYKNVFGFGSETANYAILNSYLREILAVAKLHFRILLTGEPKQIELLSE